MIFVSFQLKKAEERIAKEVEEKKRAWNHLDKLQQYLSELPTTEEHQTLQDKLKITNEEVTRLSAKVNHLARKFVTQFATFFFLVFCL